MLPSLARKVRVLALAAMVPFFAAPAVASDTLARGDAAYARRSEGQVDGRAAAGPIAEAVAAYEEAVAADPSDLEASWKLLRALFFQGEYATADPERKRAIFGSAVELGRVAESWLSRSVRDPAFVNLGEPKTAAALLQGNPNAAPVCFWSAVALASWGRAAGPMPSLRDGLAERLRRRAELVIALDPSYEAGGAHRLLGRLHAEVPRIPFVTGWVQRERAVPELKRAFSLAPDHPWNQLLLGQTLLELAPEEKPRAIGLLQRVASGSPRPDFLVEDVFIEQKAREVLEAQGG